MSLKQLTKQEKTILVCKRIIEHLGVCLGCDLSNKFFDCASCPCSHIFRDGQYLHCGNSKNPKHRERRVKICTETLAKLEAPSPEPFNEIKMTLIDSTIKQVKSCIAEALKHLDQLENMK